MPGDLGVSRIQSLRLIATGMTHTPSWHVALAMAAAAPRPPRGSIGRSCFSIASATFDYAPIVLEGRYISESEADDVHDA